MSSLDLEKWEERYANASQAPQSPSVHLTKLSARLPRQGRALDIAGGAGRHAIWLAEQGLDVTIVDISPRALAIATERAAARGCRLQTICRDLENEPLPPGPFDVVVSFHFLQRDLWPQMRAVLAPQGWLVFAQPTLRNLERHSRPPAGFLLAAQEGRRIAEGLELVEYQEDWLAEGRHEAVVFARRAV